jgi:hypothetical protein
VFVRPLIGAFGKLLVCGPDSDNLRQQRPYCEFSYPAYPVSPFTSSGHNFPIACKPPKNGPKPLAGVEIEMFAQLLGDECALLSSFQ